MKVKAAVLRISGASQPYAVSKPLRIEEVELAPPGQGEVLVRVLAAGLCHSDLSVINGTRPRPLPMVLGHEATGEILEVGIDVKGLAAGDRVVFSYVPMCGLCGPCSTGRPALCEPGALANGKGELLEGGSRWTGPDGETLRHHLGVSAFAEYVVASQRSVVKIDKGPTAGDCRAVRLCGANGGGSRGEFGEGAAGTKCRGVWSGWSGAGGIAGSAVLGCLSSGRCRCKPTALGTCT